ncbi:hypothetical protein MPH_07654 [Macrophomina phaseolina MS6]|uniref:Uncharacterized protein n=1 Tax=Macrophomina phaseolina (strain MS6) TaxID=1126212 RepID=K2RR18_MACPH|nr:hypothetical protein MPH_07654 [Macrophomina phaseolina MS6]
MDFVRLFIIHTVECNGPIYYQPEDATTDFQSLATFIRDVYQKSASDFELHIHYNRECNGRSEVIRESFDAHMKENRLFPGSMEKRHYFVCFIPKAAVPQDAFSLSPRTELEKSPDLTGEPTDNADATHDRDDNGTRGSHRAEHRTVLGTERRAGKLLGDFDIHRGAHMRSHSVPVIGGRNQPLHQPLHHKQRFHNQRACIPLRERGAATDLDMSIKRTADHLSQAQEHPKRRRISDANKPAATGALAGRPDHARVDSPQQDLPNSIALASKGPLEAEPTAATGSASRPVSISSRDSSPAPESMQSVLAPRPWEPVDDHKPLYEFLLSKRIASKNCYVVGTIKPSKVPSTFQLPESGRMNAVTVRLDRFENGRTSHFVLDQDVEGNRWPKPCHCRIAQHEVDYFPVLQPLKGKDKIREFLKKYNSFLLKGVPYATASVVDLGDEEDNESNNIVEGDLSKINGSLTAQLRVPKMFVRFRVPKLFLRHIQALDDLRNVTGNGRKRSNANASTAANEGDMAKAARTAASDFSRLLLPENEIELDREREQQERSSGSSPVATQDQPSAPGPIDNLPLTSGHVSELSTDGTTQRPSAYVLPPSKPQPPPEPANDHEKMAASSHLSRRKSAIDSNELPRAGPRQRLRTHRPPSRPNGGAYVRLNIRYTDHIDLRDYSVQLNFVYNVSAPVEWKPSEIMERIIRDGIEDRIINERSLTEQRLAELAEADLIVFIKRTADGPLQLWFRSWEVDAADVVPQSALLLTGYVGRTLDVSVEIWRRGSKGVGENKTRVLGKR